MKKRTIKIVLDVVLFILLVLLMEYHLLPNLIHEWLGIVIFILFLVHNILNYKWYTVLFKSKYTAIRITQTVINFLLLIMILLCMISSMFVSSGIFAGLNLQAGMFGRTLHMKVTAWAFVLMSVHLGLHWSMAVGMTKQFHMSVLFKTIAKLISRVVVFIIVVYGIVVFIQRGFYEELFVAEVFKGNFNEITMLTAFTFFFQTVALSFSIISMSYYTKKLGLHIKKIKRRNKQ